MSVLRVACDHTNGPEQSCERHVRRRTGTKTMKREHLWAAGLIALGGILILWAMVPLSSARTAAPVDQPHPFGRTRRGNAAATPTPHSQPDLVVLDVASNQTDDTDCARPAGVSVVVANQGRAPAYDFEITLDGGAGHCQPWVLTYLGVGGRYRLLCPVSETITSTYTAVVDSNDTVAESNEDNNRRSATITVLALTPCAPTPTPTSAPTPTPTPRTRFVPTATPTPHPTATPSPAQPTIVLPFSHTFVGSLSQRGDRNYHIVEGIPAGATLTVALIDPDGADFDVFVKRGRRPNLADYDCQGYGAATIDGCRISPTGYGTYYFMVRSYEGGGNYRLIVGVR